MAKLVTKKEYRRRRMRFQIAAGLSDFLVTIGCLALAFLCVILLIQLINWLKGDAGSSFGVFDDVFNRTIRTNPTITPIPGALR